MRYSLTINYQDGTSETILADDVRVNETKIMVRKDPNNFRWNQIYLMKVASLRLDHLIVKSQSNG